MNIPLVPNSQFPISAREAVRDFDIQQEIKLLEDWKRAQYSLLDFVLKPFQHKPSSWRDAIDNCLDQGTNGRARIWWDASRERVHQSDRLIEICFRQRHYGFLGLAPGFLASHYGLAENLAHFCAVVIACIEHQVLVQFQLKRLTELPELNVSMILTARERDVLLSLIQGENELDAAQQLGIELTTFRTHRQRLYRRLDVHSAQEAVLRCFGQQVVELLDFLSCA